MKKFLTKAAAVLLSPIISLSGALAASGDETSAPSPAEPVYNIPQGGSVALVTENALGELSERTNYFVSEITEIRGENELYIPQGTVVRIRENAELRVYKGSKLRVGGILIIEPGGSLIVSGELHSADGSELRNDGSLASTQSSTVILAGKYNCGRNAFTVFGGETALCETTVYENNGRTTIAPNGQALFSGKFNCPGELIIKGTLYTTLNNKITVGGYLNIEGEVHISGLVTLKNSSKYFHSGKINLMRSGRIFDERYSPIRENTSLKPAGSPSVETLHGIDVSYWQGAIDWKRVAQSGVDFAFIRASFSDYYADILFDYNVTEAVRHGIKAGAYHFCTASTPEEALTEAKFFLDIVKGYDLEFPLVVDIEDKNHKKLSVEELTEIARVFCEEIKKAGYTPMIYSSASWLIQKLDMSSLPYDVWVAHWGAVRPMYTGEYKAWQYSVGNVSGVNGDCDLDVGYFNYSKPK